MTAAALYPDAELVAVTYLRAALGARPESYAAGVSVYTVPPAGTTVTKGVRVRRVGGTELNQVTDSARLVTQVSHTDESSRQSLAQLVWALLRTWPGQETTIVGWPVPVVCYRVVTFGGPTNLPDPADPGRTLTQVTVEAGLRGRAF